MGKEQPASYYDEAFASSKAYKGPPSKASWYPIWMKVSSLVPKDSRVFEGGCGCGHLAQILHRQRRVSSYRGVDFSLVAIQEARKRAPAFTFLWQDLLTHPLDPSFDVYLFCELLEHVHHDLRLIKMVPSRRKVIFSLPTFDSAAHVRHFTRESGVVKRYGPYFEEMEVTPIKYWFVVEAIRAFA